MTKRWGLSALRQLFQAARISGAYSAMITGSPSSMRVQPVVKSWIPITQAMAAATSQLGGCKAWRSRSGVVQCGHCSRIVVGRHQRALGGQGTCASAAKFAWQWGQM